MIGAGYCSTPTDVVCRMWQARLNNCSRECSDFFKSTCWRRGTPGSNLKQVIGQCQQGKRTPTQTRQQMQTTTPTATRTTTYISDSDNRKQPRTTTYLHTPYPDTAMWSLTLLLEGRMLNCCMRFLGTPEDQCVCRLLRPVLSYGWRTKARAHNQQWKQQCHHANTPTQTSTTASNRTQLPINHLQPTSDHTSKQQFQPHAATSDHKQ